MTTEKILSPEEITSFAGVKETRRLWYLSVSKLIYEKFPAIRLTDSQLAELISNEYGGTKSAHIAAIRRTRCNDKSQDYVPA